MENLETVKLADGAIRVCPPPKGIVPKAGRRNCGAIDMRIAADGQWFYHGSPILRKELVKLFASVVRRDDDGDYWLVTPAEMAKITVDDAPFIAIEMALSDGPDGSGLAFRTNVDEWVAAGPAHPIRVATDARTGEPRPYLRLAQDGTEALIARSVFYQLVDQAEFRTIGGESMLAVASGGTIFPLGRAGDLP
ncbi:MAG: DUF1285 domain-containing protein [Proteobacteria bacterium]|nr:DUF1285 domain-containing protein [Pseudomonadota bacterium]